MKPALAHRVVGWLFVAGLGLAPPVGPVRAQVAEPAAPAVVVVPAPTVNQSSAATRSLKAVPPAGQAQAAGPGAPTPGNATAVTTTPLAPQLPESLQRSNGAALSIDGTTPPRSEPVPAAGGSPAAGSEGSTSRPLAVPAPPMAIRPVGAETATPGPAAGRTANATSTPTSTPTSAPAPAIGTAASTPAQAAAGPASASAPLPASLAELKRLSKEEIRLASTDKLAIYVLRDQERTLLLDFPNIRDQGRMFARLILFIERAGAPKTRVLTVPEVRAWLSQNGQALDTMTVGNNMRVGELARFFNSARFQGEPITEDEQRLYDLLIRLQLMREEAGGVAVVEPERILVSVPQASSVAGCNGCTVNLAQRAVILEHELSHAQFTNDTVYQHYSIWFWSNGMSANVREKFTRFLRERGYDADLPELCANEMQAFLLHTPDPAMFAAADVGLSETELADLRRRFREGLEPRPRATASRPYRLE